jgi:S1-C subfamily serine protease
MNDTNGQPLCIGSGFFIAEGVIATNAHVIEGAGSGSAKLVGATQTFPILGILAIDHHADLALIEVSAVAPALHLSDAQMPVVGDSVYVIGNPLGLEGTFSQGIVSGIRTTGTDSLIQMTAPISPGSSGGPVLDGAGDVVGVSVATFKEGQNLNLAVPVSYLAHLFEIRSASAAPFRTTANLSGKSATILDGLGTRSEEGVVATDLDVEVNGYSLRLVNRLPVRVSHVDVVVVFYDKSSGKVWDFDRFEYRDSIPAGLAKPVGSFYRADQSHVLTWHRGKNGGTYTYKAEVRVIGFRVSDSPY